MVNIKTNKHYKTQKNKKTRKRGKILSNNKRTKGGEATDTTKKSLMKLDVYITPKNDHTKRKIEFNVSTFYDFYDYLNEVDMYLNNTLNEELLQITDPKKHDQLTQQRIKDTIIKSYTVNLEKPKTIG
jgi:hypothetical protein